MQRYAFADRLNDSFVAPFEGIIMIDFFQEYQLVIIILAGIFLAIQLFYLIVYLSRFAFYKPKQEGANQPPVSVVICARNELENLQKFLPLVLQQQYPNYEVVLVNDCSWDGSYDYLKELALQYPILRVADIKEVEGREHGKKFALTIGIKAARYEVLLLTDADCYPQSEYWISEMMRAYRNQTQIVLGYGKFEKASGFLNYVVRWENFFNAAMYFSRTLWGKPYMGVGRNLSYKKSNFFAQKGFAAHMHINSGDDDLFIQAVAKGDNTQICVSKNAHTITLAKTTWKEWFRQKKRHNSTAKYYKSSDKAYLWLYPLSLLCFYAFAALLLILQIEVLITISVIFLRALLQIFILHTIGKKLDERMQPWLAPINELIMYLFIYPSYKLATFRLRKNKWK